MATPYSFQSLNFNNIPGREFEANRRYTAGLEGMFKSIGEGAKDIASTYMSEEERKKREAEDKKKWDNMIAQQEYQKEQNRINREYQASRDAVSDARYNNEWNEKQKKLQLEENKYYRDRNALENLKAGVRQAYTPEFLAKYGPSAQARLAAILNSNDLATAQQQLGEFNRDMYQQDMFNFNKEQANLENVPNRISTAILSDLSKENVYLDSTIPRKRNDKGQWVTDVDEVNRQIKILKAEKSRLDSDEFIDNNTIIETRNALNKKIDMLERSLLPGPKDPNDMGPEEWLKYVYQNGLK